MTKLWVFSDLHLEKQDVDLPYERPDADVIIIAGDLCHADQLMDTLSDISHRYQMPIVMVPGNHEFWSSGTHSRDMASDRLMFAEINEAAAEWQYPCIILDGGSVIFHGVRFVGATLWTDYRDGLQDEADFAWRLQEAFHLNPDHLKINGSGGKPITPSDLLALNQESTRIIRSLLAEPFDGKTVMLSHHLPHPAATPAIYADSNVNYLYCNSSAAFEDIMMGDLAPALWVCGHTHQAIDVRVGGTRILCNPHGFHSASDEEGGINGFRWDLIIDLEEA
ncbi:metallophosphoesterase [Pseudorhizobium flavum]|uniref:metallophosphoesterase n=1 Tax=Pseudorhizobium flavum TaxID=1335061 RepID=UPI00376FA4CB